MTATSEWVEPSRRHKVVRAEAGEEEAHFEMAADLFQHHLAALILLTLGGKTDRKPRHQWMEMGLGWSSLGVRMASLQGGTTVGFSETATAMLQEVARPAGPALRICRNVSCSRWLSSWR